jgi:SH3-like domain-containing protein
MQAGLHRRLVGVLAALAALGACSGRGEGADCPQSGPGGGRQVTPSGYCVPRYLSLKRGEVFGRKGPGKDYPTAFVYHARGLPVQVVDESADWRRICDPDGVSVWVSAAMVDGHRTVMALGAAPLPLRDKPADSAAPAAYLRPRSIANLGRCQGDWCQVSLEGASGWVKASEVWGLAPQPQCR